MPIEHPHHPIIYVRGFAATQGEIEETVADPYMGFNLGSTKIRMAWSRDVKRYYFESPLVRLMSDHGYEDVYVGGDDLLNSTKPDAKVPYKSIIIHRYYDTVSEDFGTGAGGSPISKFATELGDLIAKARKKICADNQIAEQDFRVYLVAHSMGGLVCRAFLQNAALGRPEDRRAVDKLFTYATPHNGIDMRVVRNVPGWLTFGDIDNFNREKMIKYLGLPGGTDASLVENFPVERIFNLVGTNPRDYTVGGGISSWAVGEASDGLVRTENAVTHGVGANGEDTESPRAFVHRSHSGHYGIVNSEEGYQNLRRFLFGNVRVDGFFDIDDISLPAEMDEDLKAGKSVKASYQFEVAVSVRGCLWQMTRREVRENSAIFRSYNDLFPGKHGTHRPPDRKQSPHLFSVFLDQGQSVQTEKKKVEKRSVSFAFDLKVLVPDYEVEGLLFLRKHYEGGAILQKQILIEAIPDDKVPGGWRIKYGFQDQTPNQAAKTAVATLFDDGAGRPPVLKCDIPIEQKTRPGVSGKIRIEARDWR